MVGGGVIGNAMQAKKKEGYYTVRPQSDMFISGCNWVKQNVNEFKPADNTIVMDNG
jgi:hypothetical protein